MTIIPIFVLCIICVFIPAGASDILFFPAPAKTLSAETMPYTQMLHTGAEGDTFYMRGRFGVDFPVIGYEFGGNNSYNSDGDGGNNGSNHDKNSRDNGGNLDVNGGNNGGNYDKNSRDYGGSPKILFGINAAAHINMLPTSGMVFPVDNFYAVLALHFSGVVNPAVSWRFYPVYHVSAHLADGSEGYIIENGVRAVSSEMTRGEVYWKPFGEILELGAGAGYYYHVCAQERLRYRSDISILITPQLTALSGKIKPYALLRAENVRQSGDNPGIDASAGILSLNDKRGFGLSVRYFNRLHSSYYFEKYEKGWGVEYTFVY